MIKIRSNLLFVGSFCCVFISQAQNPITNYDKLSLKEALAIGISNSKEIQSSKTETEISREKETEIFNHKLPEINFSSAYKRLTNLYQYEDGLFESPTVYEPTKNVYEFAVDASLPLYTGGRLRAESHKSQLGTQLAELKHSKALHILKLDIATAFLHICHLQQQKQLILDKMKEDCLIIRQVEAMRRNGASTHNEVLRTKLQLSNHRLMLTNVQNNIVIGEHQLLTFLSLDENTVLHIDPESIHENDTNTTVIQDTPALNDDLLLANKSYELQKTENEVIRSNVLPLLSLIGSYSLMNPNYKFFPPQPYFYRMGMIGLSLKYQISELYKNRTRSRLNRLAISQKQTETLLTGEKVNHALFTARQKLIEADERIRISEEAITQARENYRTVKQKYTENLSLITELIDADNAYLEAESALITNKIDKQLKYVQLQYILGKL